MPLYFVHIDDDDGRTVDDFGLEATDLDAIRELARDAAAGIIQQEVMAGRSIVRFILRIEDEARREVAVLPVNATVPQ